MAPAATLADIELEVNTARFVEIVWDGPRFYQSFLVERMKERDVVVTAWELSAAKGPSSSSLSPSLSSSKMYSRVITSLHPLPVKLPWLPEAVRSELTQTLEYNHATHVLRITEVSKVHGLPFVDPCIITEWDVVDLSPTSCTCHVTLRFAYEKRSWIEGMVESNSHTELLHFYEEWRAHAAVAFAALDAGDALHTYVGLKHLPDLLPDPSSLHVGFTPVTVASPDSKSPRLARARSSSFALMHVSPLGSPAPAPSSAASTRPRQSSLRGPAPAASVDNLRLMGRPPSPSLSLPIGGGVDDAVSMAQVRRLVDPGPSFTWRTLVKVAYDGVHRHGLLKVVTSALIDAYVQVDNVGFGSQQQVSSGVGAVAGVGTCPLGGYEGDTCAAPGAVADGPPAGLWPWRGVHVGPRAPRPWVDHATSAALVYLLIVAVEVLVCAAWAAASPAVISQPATGFVTVSRATQTEDSDYDFVLAMIRHDADREESDAVGLAEEAAAAAGDRAEDEDDDDDAAGVTWKDSGRKLSAKELDGDDDRHHARCTHHSPVPAASPPPTSSSSARLDPRRTPATPTTPSLWWWLSPLLPSKKHS